MMIKRICFSLLTFISLTTSISGSELPEKIVIEYWNHWYPFGEDGKYYTSETFEYVLQGEDYSLIKYQTLINRTLSGT
jgi:hypothetical protein